MDDNAVYYEMLTFEQNVSDHDWDHAYLVTAPRFLGYSFNPVSFWYLYDHKDELIMMVLEVNNTFDERRMYLLDATKAPKSATSEPTLSVAKRFKNVWPKDFHVSPFNSRKGSYSLSAVDSFGSGENKKRTNIDNTIVLTSSKDHAKLVARIFSQGLDFNLATITTMQTMLLLSKWFWVGFATYPRIVKEAGALFFRRKLHVWFRPEVSSLSIGRKATSSEMCVNHML